MMKKKRKPKEFKKKEVVSRDKAIPVTPVEGKGDDNNRECSQWVGRIALEIKDGTRTCEATLGNVPIWKCLCAHRKSQLILSMCDEAKMVGKTETCQG